MSPAGRKPRFRRCSPVSRSIRHPGPKRSLPHSWCRCLRRRFVERAQGVGVSCESAMTAGLSIHPEGTLVDRAIGYLAAGPANSHVLTQSVLGIAAAPAVVAERLVAALLGSDPRVGRLGDGRWMLVSPANQCPAVSDSAFAVVDVETTGGAPGKGDRITEVAVVVVRGTAIELLFESLVNP